jgi:hypothetical protein
LAVDLIVALLIVRVPAPLSKCHNAVFDFSGGCLPLPQHSGTIHRIFIENKLVEDRM